MSDESNNRGIVSDQTEGTAQKFHNAGLSQNHPGKTSIFSTRLDTTE